MKYGKYDNRSIVEKVHKDKVVDIGPHVMLDQERCVLCSRCVRFCEDVSHTNELVIMNRGAQSRITVFPGSKIENKYSGNVVDICPVGALTSKDFRFKMRVWFMSSVKSVCHGCARGCNIDMDYKDETVYRFKPRANTAVNDYWMCDDGRMSYKEINTNRFLEPVQNGQLVEYSDAFNSMLSLIKTTKSRFGPKSVAAVASPHSTVEDNWLLKTFMNTIVGSDKVYGADFRADGYQDDILIRADKTPNRTGLDYLEINRSSDDFINALNSKEIKLLIVMNNDIIGEGGNQIKTALEGIELVSLSSHNTETSKFAKLSLPVSNYSEKYGSLVNFEGQLQKFEKAFDTFQLQDSLAVPEWELFANLIKEFDSERQYFDIEDVWTEIRSNVSAFSGLSYYDIGDTGINIPNKIKAEEEAKIVDVSLPEASHEKEIVV